MLKSGELCVDDVFAAASNESLPLRQGKGSFARSDSQVKERLVSRGFNIAASSPESFAAFLRQESDISGRLVRDAGIKPE